MISSKIHLITKHFYKRPEQYYRLCSTVSQSKDERDPAPLFFDRHVQDLLMTLTRPNYVKIFSARRDGTPLRVPIFKFMTDEQLQQAKAQISEKVNLHIQMPPVVKIREEPRVISKDIALQGFSKENYVFTDISFGYNNRNRLIVVRDTNGTLRYANNDERRRVNQVYFPINGREIHIPRMFKKPYFDNLLEKKEFEFILDKACLQFEPDHPEYHKITKSVYFYVNEMSYFNNLRSTRHFGPMVFHLVWENNFHNLLLDLINSKNIKEAAALIHLYHKFYPEAKSNISGLEDIDLVTSYIENDVDSGKQKLMTVLKTYKDLKDEKEKVSEGILKAHGLIDNTDEESET